MDNAQEVEKYLNSCHTEFWQSVFRSELEIVKANLSPLDAILSVGCGPAIIESELSKLGYDITGLDVSQEALNCAGDSIRAISGTAEQMPFSESTFDVVLFIVSLQFLDNYEAAIEETARVLRSGGKLIVLLLNPDSQFYKEKMSDKESYVQKIKHTDNTSIEAIIAAKFAVESQYCVGILGQSVYESEERDKAALYVIKGKNLKTATSKSLIRYTPIGIIHSEHKEASKTPIQPRYANECEGWIEIFPEYKEGLSDLDGFSHAYLIYHLHRANQSKLRVKPFLQNEERGVFATRSPNRPNAIGLSIVEITKIEGTSIYVKGVDILDCTPLLDIKPYVSRFDSVETTRNGWHDDVDEEAAMTRGKRDYKKHRSNCHSLRACWSTVATTTTRA